MAAQYEVRIAGPVDGTSRLALEDLGLPVTSGTLFVLICGEMDQPLLHGLLARVRALGLQLEEVRRMHLPLSRAG